MPRARSPDDSADPNMEQNREGPRHSWRSRERLLRGATVSIGCALLVLVALLVWGIPEDAAPARLAPPKDDTVKVTPPPRVVQAPEPVQVELGQADTRHGFDVAPALPADEYRIVVHVIDGDTAGRPRMRTSGMAAPLRHGRVVALKPFDLARPR